MNSNKNLFFFLSGKKDDFLVLEYANLVRNMWSSSTGHSVATPSAFKSTVGRFAPRFLGYSYVFFYRELNKKSFLRSFFSRQQDSQEFLRYLLQGLHEDVNRVRTKPNPKPIDEAAEDRKESVKIVCNFNNQRCLTYFYYFREIVRARDSWKRCLLYDDSAILSQCETNSFIFNRNVNLCLDIFAGQLKSTLECTQCHYKSITFDMFWDLSIPLPRVIIFFFNFIFNGSFSFSFKE